MRWFIVISIFNFILVVFLSFFAIINQYNIQCLKDEVVKQDIIILELKKEILNMKEGN